MSAGPMDIQHRRAFWLLCALAALQVVWYGWWLPPAQISRAAGVSLALVWFTLPLLAARVDAERGLLIGALMALGYFSHGVMEVFANPPARLPASIEIALSVAIVGFAGLPSWQRARKRRREREADVKLHAGRDEDHRAR